MIENKTIICDSNIPWYHNRYSKHHLMSRFAQKNRVIFVNPQIDLFYYLRTVGYNPFRFFRRTHQPEGEELTVFTPLAVPFRNKFDFVHKIDPRYHGHQIKRVLGNVDMEKLVIFLGNPWNIFLLDYFESCSCSIYHCSDNFPALFSGSFREKIAKREDEIIKRADIVICVSEQLFNKCIKLNPNSYIVMHGVDEKFFWENIKDLSEPLDLRCISHPRVGFIGSIDATIDFDLLRYIADKMKHVQFVFIGSVDELNKKDFADVCAYKNVHHLGKKSWQILQYYIRWLDVCIIPWALTDFTLMAECPLKLPEYLASGREVVSSSIPVEESFRSAVKIASNYEEFVTFLEEAVANFRQPGKAEKISAIVKEMTWERKALEISSLIEKHLYRNDEMRRKI